jgi:hypothetical protein
MNAKYIHHYDSHPDEDNYKFRKQRKIFASDQLEEQILKLLHLGWWKANDDKEGVATVETTSVCRTKDGATKSITTG